jgi:membrane protein DedA with SNARE-associated domain
MAGALAARGHVDTTLVYLLGWATVLTLDVLLYLVGTRAGPGMRRSRLARGISEARWVRLEEWIERRGVLAVVAARFVMGARIPVFLLAGAAGMPRARFVGVAAGTGLLSAGLPYALGYAFGTHLEALLETLAAVRWAIFAFVVVTVLCWWLWRRRS